MIGLLVIAICVSVFATIQSKEITKLLQNPALLDLRTESLINKEKQKLQKDKTTSLNALVNSFLLFEQLYISDAQNQLQFAKRNEYVRLLVKEETGLNIDELSEICTNYFLAIKESSLLADNTKDCPYCNGIGYSPCNKCKGRGYITSNDDKICKECTGLGLIVCQECLGTGISKSDSKVELEDSLSKDELQLTKIRKLIDVAAFLADGGPDFFTSDALQLAPTIGK